MLGTLVARLKTVAEAKRTTRMASQ